MRYRSYALLALAMVALASSGCGRDQRPSREAPRTGEDLKKAAVEKADAAAKKLVQALGAELKRALSEGGPEAAVNVCASVAQEMSADVAKREGLHLRRVALRLRNEKNGPDDYERKVLERWQAAGDVPDRETEVVTVAGGRRELRYMKPILLKAVCGMCHGAAAQIDPAVRTVIRKHYPDDRAVDFKPGDLRGAVSVRVALEEE